MPKKSSYTLRVLALPFGYRQIALLVLLWIAIVWLVAAVYCYHRLPEAPLGDEWFQLKNTLHEAGLWLAGSRRLPLPVSPLQKLLGYFPIVTAALLALLLLYQQIRLSLFFMTLKRHPGFVLVYGRGPLAFALARHRFQSSAAVVHAGTEGGADASNNHARPRPVTIDHAAFERYAETLLRGAGETVAIDQDDLRNLDFSQRYQQVRAGGTANGNGHLLVCIQNDALRDTVVQRLESTAGAADLYFASLNQLFARWLLQRRPCDRFCLAANRLHQHALVVGMGSLGKTLSRTLLRQSALSHGERFHLSLADPSREAAAQFIETQLMPVKPFADIGPALGLHNHNQLADEVLAEFQRDKPLTAIYICLENESLGTHLALKLESQYLLQDNWCPPIYLFTSSEFDLGPLLQQQRGFARIGMIEPVSLVNIVQQPLNYQQRLDQLAKVLHNDYLSHRLEDGEQLGDRPGLQPWENLPEQFRDENRYLADHHGMKLRDQGLFGETTIAAAGNADSAGAVLTNPVVEALSIAEHQRWWLGRALSGWTYSPGRDDRHKRHPDMVSWANLTEPKREIDRQMVRQLPALLTQSGQRLKRALYIHCRQLEEFPLSGTMISTYGEALAQQDPQAQPVWVIPLFPLPLTSSAKALLDLRQAIILLVPDESAVLNELSEQEFTLCYQLLDRAHRIIAGAGRDMHIVDNSARQTHRQLQLDQASAETDYISPDAVVTLAELQ